MELEPIPEPELGEIDDLLILLSSFFAIASQINGDKSEKFASNSFIDPSYKIMIYILTDYIFEKKKSIYFDTLKSCLQVILANRQLMRF